MKTIVIIALIVLPLFLGAEAYTKGIGIIIGSPTGFTAKFLLSRTAAVAVNAGWSLLDHHGIHVTGDYQFLFPGAITSEEGKRLDEVVPYLGVGGRLRVKETEGPGDETDLHVGLRVGGGVEYLVERFGLFLELYPVVDFVPETDVDFEGGLGIRFYF